MRDQQGRSGKRLRSDPQLRAELELCDRWGVPHSHFLGGPPRWTDLDRDKALAYALLARQTCVCGTRLEEWDPELGGARDAYVGDTVRCPGCQRLEEERAQIPSSELGVKPYLRTPTAEEMAD